MQKPELKNFLVELNLQGIITDKELITFNKRLESKFLNSEASTESQTLDEHEGKGEKCEDCIWEYNHSKDMPCCMCKNYDRYKAF